MLSPLYAYDFFALPHLPVIKRRRKEKKELQSNHKTINRMAVSTFLSKITLYIGVPIVAQWLTNPTRNHEVAGSVPAIAQWVNNPALP